MAGCNCASLPGFCRPSSYRRDTQTPRQCAQRCPRMQVRRWCRTRAVVRRAARTSELTKIGTRRKAARRSPRMAERVATRWWRAMIGISPAEELRFAATLRMLPPILPVPLAQEAMYSFDFERALNCGTHTDFSWMYWNGRRRWCGSALLLREESFGYTD